MNIFNNGESYIADGIHWYINTVNNEKFLLDDFVDIRGNSDICEGNPV
jgi:hypothetical protein